MSHSEFDEIARLFAPISFGAPEALDLKDDAAIIPARPGFDLVVTKDALVLGVHLVSDAAPEDVAAKLLRANLSDLAAKGAKPDAAFLAIAWPRGTDDTYRARFAAALKTDAERFGVRLFGGDTVTTPGPLTASLTLLGYVPCGSAVLRSGAQAGDIVLVSGEIGDGGLGLLAARGELELAPAVRATLLTRYVRPEPRLELADALRRLASSSADVSDGLFADAAHLASASGVHLEIDLAEIPVSAAARQWMAGRADQRSDRLWLASAGDDYEIVLTASEPHALALQAEGRSLGLAITPIGRVLAGEGISVRDDAHDVTPPRLGYDHFGEGEIR